MGLTIQWDIVLAFGFGLLVLYFCGTLLLAPARLLVKLLLNAVLGGAALLLLNWVTAGFSFHLPVNVITAAVTGFLGVPGVVLLILTTWILKL